MSGRDRPVVRVAAAISSLLPFAAPVAAAPAPAAPAAMSPDSPALLWQDVTGVAVTCLVRTPRGVDTGMLHRRVCEAVRAQAARGAPVPVTIASPGGAALAPGRVTLLVEAGLSAVRGAPVLALAIRPFRNAAGAGQLFAATPRAVAPDDAAALDAAVRALLAETLPWHAQRGGARPVN